MITFAAFKDGLPDLHIAPAWSYLRDADGQPCAGEITFDEHRIVCDTPEPRAALNLLYEVSGFGQVMMATAALPHSPAAYRLDDALVDGRRAQIERLLARGRAAGFAPSAEWAAHYAQAVGTGSASSLPSLMQLGEDLLNDFAALRLKRRIEAGNALTFGAQAFGVELGEDYRARFKALCGSGTAPFYFFLTRPARDQFSWDVTDRVVNWLVAEGIEVEAAPLIWLHPYGLAPWMRALSFDEARAVVLEQVRAAVERYGDRVRVWEMLNEPADGDANGLGLTVEQLLELTGLISVELKRLQPNAYRILNFSDPFGAKSYIHDRPSVPPAYYLRRCLERGIEFEAIGLQCYFGIKRYFSCRDLLDVAELLDTFAAFGKDIRITEVSCPSQHAVDPTCFFAGDHPAAGGYWHGPWSEERQADFAEKLYTLLAAEPAVKAITWWDFADRGMSRDIGARFIPFGGLLRRDLSPKPAYERLLQLRHRLASGGLPAPQRLR